MPDQNEPRRIDVLAVPWDSTSRVTREGYRERFARGATTADALVGLPVIDAHFGTAVGVVEAARETDAGIVATLRISDTDRGRDLYTLSADGALGASLGFDADARDAVRDRSGVVTRSRVLPREVSLTPLPAYETARVLATREAPPMPDTPPATTDAAPTATADAAPDTVRTSAPPTTSAPVVEYVTPADLEAAIAQADARRAAVPNNGAGHGHPLSRFDSFGSFAQAAYRGEVTPDEVRALVDQTTDNNPGVVPPSWLGEVRGIVARTRYLIEGTGGAMSPGASGMSAAWPYFDGDLSTLVGPQTDEKTEITSARVDVKKGAADLVTYAGGSDLAFQLIERSSPAYLDAYLRIMAAAYAAVTERAYTLAAVAAAGAGTAATVAAFYPAVIDQAAAVFDATGSAPSVGLLAADVWSAIAGKVDADGRPIYPPVNPQNAPGTPNGVAATGGIVVAGIPFYRSKNLANGNALITNGDAVRWLEDGPRTIQADNVALLGRDVAVYGYGAAAPFIPAGVRRLTGLTVAPATK
jgi:HK97 family phage prohead protease